MRSDASVEHGGGAHTPSTILRVLALAVLGVLLGGGVVVVTRGPSPAANPVLQVPLPLDSLRGTLASGDRWHAGELPGPAVLLYVDEQCPWCAAELRAWADLVKGAPHRAPVVVVSRRSNPGFVGPPLSRFLVRDRTGSIGRALGLRGVPATAVVTPRGVTHLFYGLSGQGRLDSLFHILAPPPPHPSLSTEGDLP